MKGSQQRLCWPLNENTIDTFCVVGGYTLFTLTDCTLTNNQAKGVPENWEAVTGILKTDQGSANMHIGTHMK